MDSQIFFFNIWHFMRLLGCLCRYAVLMAIPRVITHGYVPATATRFCLVFFADRGLSPTAVFRSPLRGSIGGLHLLLALSFWLLALYLCTICNMFPSGS